MKIKHLRILNIQSLRGEFFIDFEGPELGPAGIFAITGPTGAGKTTLLDGITLALYGQVHRDKPAGELITYGCGEAEAELLLENKGKLILAKWSLARARKKPDGALQQSKREVSVWNEATQAYEIQADKIKDADLQIASLTGLDFKRFKRSVLLAQGDFAAFLSAKPSERKDLLEQITGTEIYTRISQKAYYKAKEERGALDELEKKLERVGLKTEEEISALKEEQSGKDNQLAELQAKKKVKEQSLDKYKRVEKEKSTLQEFINIQSANQEQLVNFQPQLLILNNYENVLPLKSEWDNRNQLSQENVVLEKEYSESEQRAKKLQNELAKYSEETEALKKELQKAKAELPEVDDKIKKATQLETKIENIEKQLSEVISQGKKAKEEYQEIQNQIKETSAKTKTWSTKYQELINWEQNNPSAVQLENSFPEIKSSIDQLNLHIQQGRQLKSQFTTAEETLEKTNVKHAALEKQVADLKQTHEAVSKKLTAALSTTAGKDSAEKMSNLRREYNAKVELQSQLGQFSFTIKEQARIEDLLANLKDEIKQLDQTIAAQEKNTTASKKALKESEQEEDAALKIHHQQLLIKNYERERSELSEGEQCPLCGAEHHPSIHDLTAYVDESKTSWEKAAERLEKARKAEAEAVQALEILKKQKATIVGSEGNEYYSIILQLESEFKSNSQLLADVRSSLNKGKDEAIDEHAILHEQEIIHDFLHKYEDTIAQIELLNKEEVVAEKAWHESKVKLESLQGEAATLKKTLAERSEQLSESRNQYQGLEKQLKTSLAPFDLTFNPANSSALLEELSKKIAQFKNLGVEKQNQEKQLSVLEKEAEQLEKRSVEKEKFLGELKTSISKLAEEKESCEKQKKALIGNVSPDEYKNALLENISAKEEALKAKADKANKLREEIGVLIAKEKDLKKRVELAGKKIETIDIQLKAKLAELGLPESGSLASYFISQEQFQSLRNRNEELKKLIVSAEANVVQQKKIIEESEKAIADIPTVEELNTEIVELTLQEKEWMERSGAIKEILQRELEKGKEAAELRKEIKLASKEFSRWDQLRNLIGSAKGDVFSTFAQGITLNQLIRLANIHLRKLNGRYKIEQNIKSALDLVIIDTFQADNRRSMGSLSGGESFLVSLALALGLSDLAGSRTNIKSLFIDEGFGSLDEQSLSLAIETLENLQSEGKTIGLISHVKELQERIRTQIKIIPGTGGFSAIEIT